MGVIIDELAALTLASHETSSIITETMGNLEPISVCPDGGGSPPPSGAGEDCEYITANTLFVIPTDYPDLDSCLQDIQCKYWHRDVTVTIQIPIGIIEFSTPIELKQAGKIKITGGFSPSLTFNYNSLAGTLTGTLGDYLVGYNCPDNQFSDAGSPIGYYLIASEMNDTTRSPDLHYLYSSVSDGVWEITGVDGNSIIVKNTCQTEMTNEEGEFGFFTGFMRGVTGVLTMPQTVLKFNGCGGIINGPKSTLTLEDIVIIGDKTPGTIGIENKGQAHFGDAVGIASFGSGVVNKNKALIHSERLFVSSCVDNPAILIEQNSVCRVKSIAATGNTHTGVIVNLRASLVLNGEISDIFTDFNQYLINKEGVFGAMSGNGGCGLVVEGNSVAKLIGETRISSNAGYDIFSATNGIVGYNNNDFLFYGRETTESGGMLNQRAFYTWE